MSMQFDGRHAFITGGARGIGYAIAGAFGREGAALTIIDCHAENLDLALRSLRGSGFAVHGRLVDVTDPGAVEAAVEEAERRAPIDILINNAGIALIRSIDELTEADFDTTISVNLKSAFLCTQAVLPHMRAQGWGRIINISSGAARGAGGVGVHYNASKAGMEGMTRGYAARLVKQGITVNAVAPSLIDTDMVKSGLASSASRIPLGRFGTSEEVAQVVMMLIGNEYMTGQTVALSGGMAFN
jgi:3-oxoacyl-[acyl-carrier protein] reductase